MPPKKKITSSKKKKPSLSSKDSLLNDTKAITSFTGTFNVISILFLVIYLCNIYYLHTLQTCDCFKVINLGQPINLKYLLVINYVLLFFLVVNAITFNFSIKKGGVSTQFYIIMILTILLLAAVIAVYIYYVMNIYELYKKESLIKSCDCLNNNLKYSLYVHGIIVSVSIIFQIIYLILLFYLLLSI